MQHDEPELRRSRGQRGPAKRRQELVRIIGRHVGIAKDTGRLAPNRNEWARMAAVARRRWPIRAYWRYADLLRNDGKVEHTDVRVRKEDAPPEILVMAPRRVAFDADDVATWAYRHRHQDVSWSRLEKELDAEYLSLLERASGRSREIESDLADLRSKPQTDEVRDAIRYWGAVLAFVAEPLQHDEHFVTADSIRQIASRFQDVWDVAEGYYGQSS